ncbi:hypothetical protein HD806DRAFT_538646 [Xylariaceae sp. AK1471]|nr:hypothetical protein HD806DRAFT_538646 [Xylariaceae sp. AK1471]
MSNYPFRVITFQYPPLSLHGHLDWPESMPAAEKTPIAVLEAHLEGLQSTPENIMTAVPNGSRTDLINSMMHNGRSITWGAANEFLDPMRGPELVAKNRMPPTLLFHGRDDSLV